MTETKIEATSAGRVLNASKADLDALFVERFGPRWTDYRRRWAAAAQRESIEDFPLFVRFETQFKCNGRCRMCAHGHPDLRADYAYPDYLPLEVFRRLVDECAEHDCPSAGLSQTNEPLLDPDLIERINYVSARGVMDIHLNTNGQLLTEEMSRRLLDTGVTRLLISLDAVSREVYRQIRPGLDFDLITSNLEKFLELRAARGSALPVVRVSFLLQAENKHELEAFQAKWVDRVEYVAVQRYVPISPIPGDLRGRAISEAPVRGDQKCAYPFESLFVHGDGTVVPCAAHRARHISVGNIHRQSLHQIWHSPAMAELREAHQSGDLSRTRLCPTCLF